MYSHYWKWDKGIANKEAFIAWSTDVKKISENLPEHSQTAGAYYDRCRLGIAGIDTTTGPIFTEKKVAFSGAGLDPSTTEKLWGDNFLITLTHMRKKQYDFCQTDRKPYDLLVCAALIRLKYHFPQVKVKSDGTYRYWGQAIELCQKLFGEEGGRMPFTEGEEFESPSWT